MESEDDREGTCRIFLKKRLSFIEFVSYIERKNNLFIVAKETVCCSDYPPTSNLRGFIQRDIEEVENFASGTKNILKLLMFFCKSLYSKTS